MPFDSNHYVPVLRWRAAEKEALLKLEPEYKKHITPLLEMVVVPTYKSGKKETEEEMIRRATSSFLRHLESLTDDILAIWGTEEIIVDFKKLPSSIRLESLKNFLGKATQRNLFLEPKVSIIPVIYLDREKELRKECLKFTKEMGSGIALRLTRSDLQPDLEGKTLKLLQEIDLTEDKIHLLVDFACLGDENEAELLRLLRRVPLLKNWKTFTVIGGAFPENNGQFKKNNTYKLPRKDWTNWKKICAKLKRKPTFGDYTTQCPNIKKPIPGAPVSASIKLATQEVWIYMKGENLYGEKSAKYRQYPALAKLMMELEEFREFGEGFSVGCKYIGQIASEFNSTEKKINTGSPRTWASAAISHHLACTAFQISQQTEHIISV